MPFARPNHYLLKLPYLDTTPKCLFIRQIRRTQTDIDIFINDWMVEMVGCVFVILAFCIVETLVNGDTGKFFRFII